MGIAYQDILCYSAAGLLIATALWLGWWSLLRDRARGRRRCPKCWYDLRGTPGMQCSECGFIAKRERQLQRTRRRWRAALFSMVILAGGLGALLAPRVRTLGWYSVFPRPVLVFIAPSVEQLNKNSPGGPFAQFVAGIPAELSKRGARARMSSFEWRHVVNQLARYSTRQRWPVGIPVAIRYEMPNWCVSDWHGAPGLNAIAHVQECNLLEPDSVHGFTIGAAPRVLGGGYSMELTGYVNRPDHTSFCPRGTASIPLQAVASIEDVLRPLYGSVMDDAIKDVTSINVAPVAFSPYSDIRVLVILRRLADSPVKSVGFGFRVEFMRDEQLVVTAFIDPEQPDGTWGYSSSPEYTKGLGRINGFPWSDFRSDRRGEHWRVVLRGDGEMALRDWDRNTYWKGKLSYTPDAVLSSK